MNPPWGPSTMGTSSPVRSSANVASPAPSITSAGPSGPSVPHATKTIPDKMAAVKQRIDIPM